MDAFFGPEYATAIEIEDDALVTTCFSEFEDEPNATSRRLAGDFGVFYFVDAELIATDFIDRGFSKRPPGSHPSDGAHAADVAVAVKRRVSLAVANGTLRTAVQGRIHAAYITPPPTPTPCFDMGPNTLCLSLIKLCGTNALEGLCDKTCGVCMEATQAPTPLCLDSIPTDICQLYVSLDPRRCALPELKGVCDRTCDKCADTADLQVRLAHVASGRDFGVTVQVVGTLSPSSEPTSLPTSLPTAVPTNSLPPTPGPRVKPQTFLTDVRDFFRRHRILSYFLIAALVGACFGCACGFGSRKWRPAAIESAPPSVPSPVASPVEPLAYHQDEKDDSAATEVRSPAATTPTSAGAAQWGLFAHRRSQARISAEDSPPSEAPRRGRRVAPSANFRGDDGAATQSRRAAPVAPAANFRGRSASPGDESPGAAELRRAEDPPEYTRRARRPSLLSQAQARDAPTFASRSSRPRQQSRPPRPNGFDNVNPF
ncbi:hypothetical protein M885DRAFT_566492 [Pelagophyceae sp. CCMP2097]|nr:hypothetical protein M885DRAFT_566492 [Pelagophyceae sp. CCMP2097]